MKIIVLGAGMVGSAMALYLSKNQSVTVADFNQSQISNLISKSQDLKGIQLDVTNEWELKKELNPFDLVICAVPGFLGYQTLTWIIESRKDTVDISFFPEDALALHDLAKTMEVTAIVDCGVAPGMSNLILGYHNCKMKIKTFDCIVGGLPKVKKWPFCYKAPFSPIDVLEEYTRSARYIENGHVVTKSALSDVETVEFDGVGTLESFNSDGLRSIIFTMSHIPNMKEKTLRYPGHVEYIRVLKESGFFSEKPIKLRDGLEVNPMEFTSKILFDEWKLGETEEEITVMRISVEGENESGIYEKITYHLHDEFNQSTQTSSMARTTGYTATAAANLIMSGMFTQKGVFPPELVSCEKGCFDFILKYLNERGVVYKKETILG